MCVCVCVCVLADTIPKFFLYSDFTPIWRRSFSNNTPLFFIKNLQWCNYYIITNSKRAGCTISYIHSSHIVHWPCLPTTPLPSDDGRRWLYCILFCSETTLKYDRVSVYDTWWKGFSLHKFHFSFAELCRKCQSLHLIGRGTSNGKDLMEGISLSPNSAGSVRVFIWSFGHFMFHLWW